MAFGCGDIRELAKLLSVSTPTDDANISDEDESSPKGHSLKLGPGSVGPPKNPQPSEFNLKANEGSWKNSDDNAGDIWNTEEVSTSVKGIAYDVDNDPREKPTYETYYRQAVCTEDVFLQMGNKTPGTASCENLVVIIDLPGENFRSVKLDIKPEVLFLRSPKYVFRLPLPHPVDPNGGNAKWDQDKEKLSVTLKLARELDLLNF